jgi:hypothetical protein
MSLITLIESFSRSKGGRLGTLSNKSDRDAGKVTRLALSRVPSEFFRIREIFFRKISQRDLLPSVFFLVLLKQLFREVRFCSNNCYYQFLSSSFCSGLSRHSGPRERRRQRNNVLWLIILFISLFNISPRRRRFAESLNFK